MTAQPTLNPQQLRHALARIPVADSYLRPREYQILKMYIAGARHADMPATLRCSPRTIDAHISAAKHRVGANTIHQLIAMVATADALRERGRPSNRETVLESPRSWVFALDSAKPAELP